MSESGGRIVMMAFIVAALLIMGGAALALKELVALLAHA
jgi:hypothetical protein